MLRANTSAAVLRYALAVALALVASGCPEETVECGDGVVSPGETEATCCADVGCAFGSCDEAAMACVDPWVASCAGADTCLGDGPYMCRDLAPPAYDCDGCGCPGDERCVGGACFLVSDLAGERERDEIPPDLALESYFAIVDELARAPMTLVDVAEAIALRARVDRRASAVVVGGIGPTEDEIELSAQLVDALGDLDLVASATAVATSTDACLAVASLANDATAEGGVDVALVQADIAHREVCSREAMFASCVLPTASDCLLAAGRRPATVMLIDHTALLARVDRALLLRASNNPPGEVVFQIDSVVNRWRQSVDGLGVPERFALPLATGERTVRGDFARDDPAMWWLVIVDRGAPPWGLLGYRAIWTDSPAQQYMIDNDMTGRDCDWTLSETELSYVCEQGTARLEATLDRDTLELLNVATS